MSLQKHTCGTHNYLNSLPLELVECCVFWILSPKDLSCLALTSRVFYRIVVPNHIEYRNICCRFNDVSLWKHLAQRRDLAARIRTLEVDLAAGRKPSILRKPTAFNTTYPDLTWSFFDVDPLPYFLSAIGNMCSLAKFSWVSSPEVSDVEVVNVFEVLNSPYLKDLRVRRHFSIGETARRTLPQAFCSLTRLLLDFPPGFADEITEMVLCCEYLQDLSLSVGEQRGVTVSLQRLVKQANWLKLRTLEIRGSFHANDVDQYDVQNNMVINSRSRSLEKFLKRHHQLECLALLQFSHSGLHHLAISPDTLPKLRSLACRSEAILRCGVIPHVATLRHLCLDYRDAEGVAYDTWVVLQILKQATALTSLVLGRWSHFDIEFLTRSVSRNIEKLEIVDLVGAPYSDDYEAALDPYAGLTKLTHLNGVLRAPYFQEDRFSLPNVRAALIKFEALEFVLLHCFGGPLERYRILRDEKGLVGVHKLKENDSVDDLDSKQWGGFLRL